MDTDDKMTDEIQQWFKVHIVENENVDQLCILLSERVEEESIILNLLRSEKRIEAEQLLGRWIAFDSYKEHQSRWDRFMKELDLVHPDEYPEKIGTLFSKMLMDLNLPHPDRYLSFYSSLNKVGDLHVVGHSLIELTKYEKWVRQHEEELRNTNNVQMLFFKAIVLERFGWFDEALHILDDILTLEPTRDDAYFRRGIIHYRKEEYPKSVKDFRRCLELNPANKKALRCVALGLYASGKGREAIIEIDRLIEIDPADHTSHYLKGIMHTNLEEFDNAKQSLDRALTQNHDNAKYVQVFCRVLLLMGNHDKAIKEAQNAVNTSPESAELVYNLATVYVNLNNIDKAEEQYKRVLQIRSDHPDALIYLGGIFSNNGEYEKGLEYLKRGIEIDPEHATGLHSAGVTLWRMERRDDAIKYLDRSISLHRNAHSAVLKTYILVEQGKTAESLEFARCMIKSIPETKKVFRNDLRFDIKWRNQV